MDMDDGGLRYSDHFYYDLTSSDEEDSEDELFTGFDEIADVDAPTHEANKSKCGKTDNARLGIAVEARISPSRVLCEETVAADVAGKEPLKCSREAKMSPSKEQHGETLFTVSQLFLVVLLFDQHGKIISRDELDKILSKEKTEVIEAPDIDEAMAQAVDIGENDDEGEDSEAEVDEQGEKITRNWSVLKSTPQLTKPKEKPKKEGPMSLDEAVDNSENLTDFLMDFEEE